MEYIVQTECLCKSYGKANVLNGLTMNVPKGSVYGLIGKNGAGKTTLIRIMCGLQVQTGGGCKICGVDSKSKNIVEVRKKVAAVVETPAVFPDFTAKENLVTQYEILGIKPDNSVDELLSFVGLADTGKKTVKNFSLGMRQRLGIAVALCGSPELLILDEPINGLDPQGIIDIRDLIKRLNAEKGITIIISSHILDELSKVATCYGFIDSGRIIKEMGADEFDETRKRCIHIVTDKRIGTVLSDNGYQCSVISDTEANVYGDVDITPLVMTLASSGVNIKRIIENDESLEHYFLSLIGGGK